MADETEPPTGGKQDEKKRRRRKLHAVPSKPRNQTTPPGVHRFGPGNKFGTPQHRKRRTPANPVEQMDRLVKRTLDRIGRKTYSYELAEGGKRRKVEQPLDAPRANAIASLVRLRLDIFSQYSAGEELRRLQGEVERLTTMVPRPGTGRG